MPQTRRSGVYTCTTPASITGTTTQGVLGLVTVPAALCVPNTFIDIVALWSSVNNANGKTLQILENEGGAGLPSATFFYNAGGISGFSFMRCQAALMIGPDAAYQSGGLINSIGGVGGGTAAKVVGSKALQNGLDIIFAAQLANAADFITLEGYTIRIDA